VNCLTSLQWPRRQFSALKLRVTGSAESCLLCNPAGSAVSSSHTVRRGCYIGAGGLVLLTAEGGCAEIQTAGLNDRIVCFLPFSHSFYV
jgi:hypothetical protein